MSLEISYKTIYKLFNHNSLILKKEYSNFTTVINKNIKNNFGIYIFYKNSKSYENIIYIGKAGEITTNRDKKSQGLQKRLTNIRDNKPANIYYKDIFDFLNLSELIIEYFETGEIFIPAFIEASLIQEYYSNNNCKPPQILD